MNSSKWGPHGWQFMYYVAAGYDLNETPKHIKDPQYKLFFQSIGDVLPCFYCRESYRPFFKKLDIDRYMNMTTCGLIRFVYDIQGLVNNKLETQEERVLRESFKSLSETISPDDPQFWKLLRQKAHKTCYTKPLPPFENVVQEIYKHKAGCSAHTKTCRLPLPTGLPTLPPEFTTPDPNISAKTDHETYTGGKTVKRTSKRHRLNSRRKSSRKTSRQRKSNSRKTRSRLGSPRGL
jgi:hypothetical protein